MRTTNCLMVLAPSPQVESNMARLGVNTAETDPEAKEFVTQMDVEAAAELIATRTSLIT